MRVVDRIDAAVSEAGYPNSVRHPGPGDPPKTKFMLAASVPTAVGYRALMLLQLSTEGAGSMIRCPAHPLVHDDNRCPKYPVGALLAGVIEGCGSA